jgi:hypothetical protein
MNIRNVADYQAQFWDWTFLNDCFGGTPIRVTDIDGMVERHGFFLMIETKKPTVDEIPQGQAILFDQWCRNQKHMLLLIYGYNGKPEEACVWPADRVPAGADEIHAFVSDWYQWANAWGRPDLRPKLQQPESVLSDEDVPY